MFGAYESYKLTFKTDDGKEVLNVTVFADTVSYCIDYYESLGYVFERLEKLHE